MTPLVVCIGLLGLAIGSFLNVVIARVPAGQSVLRPPSNCGSCHRRIRSRHNVPVLSWLALRGRCADCAAPISVRYPFIELGTASLFVVITVHVVRLNQLPLLPAVLFFTAIGIALSAIDLDVRRLPNSIVVPAYPVIAALVVVAAELQDDRMILLRAAIGGAALVVGYLAIALAHPGGMGLGDVKLAGVAGIFLGALSFRALLVGTFAAFVLGGICGLVLMAARRGGRRSAIPFGPFMVGAALIAFFAAGPISDTYLRLAVHR